MTSLLSLRTPGSCFQRRSMDSGNLRTRLRFVGQQHQFYCYLLESAAYPVPLEQRAQYLYCFDQLDNALTARYRKPAEPMLLMSQLHVEGASENLSKYGASWMPEIGVAVWPHKPPPAIWSKEEFQSFVPGEIPRPPIAMIFRLNGTVPNRANVLEVMGGRGALAHVWLYGARDEFYKGTDRHFRAVVTDRLHLAFPFFFPLLDSGTLLAMPEELVSRLFLPMQCYIRESTEDKGLLIIADEDLRPVIESLGWSVDVARSEG
jgi:hypothetical protein